MKGFDGEIALW